MYLSVSAFRITSFTHQSFLLASYPPFCLTPGPQLPISPQQLVYVYLPPRTRRLGVFPTFPLQFKPRWISNLILDITLHSHSRTTITHDLEGARSGVVLQEIRVLGATLISGSKFPSVSPTHPPNELHKRDREGLGDGVAKLHFFDSTQAQPRQDPARESTGEPTATGFRLDSPSVAPRHFEAAPLGLASCLPRKLADGHIYCST